LKMLDWITHTQEELMDAILYLERLKHEVGSSSSKATTE